MKKLLFVAILLISIKSHSQCLIPFDEFVKSTKFSLSEFDTFALKNGFSFDSTNENYKCDTGSIIELKRQGAKNLNDKNIITTYFFTSKTQYLDYKIILESKGKLINQNVNDNGLVLQYNYDGKILLLQSVKLVGSDGTANVYLITLGN